MRRLLTILALVLLVPALASIALLARPRQPERHGRAIVGPPAMPIRRPPATVPPPEERQVYLPPEVVMPPAPSQVVVAPPAPGPDPATFTPPRASTGVDGDRPPRPVPGLP